MISISELAPASGAEQILSFKIKRFGDNQPKWEITDLDFSKDIEGAAGTGTVNFYLGGESFYNIALGDEWIIALGWKYLSGKILLKEFSTGFVKGVKISGKKVNIDISDKGVLLEAQATVNYTKKKRSYIIKDLITKAGLIPNVSFKGVIDDTIDFSSATDSGGGEGITGAGMKSCSKCSLKPGGANKGPYYTSSVANKCPECGKVGTIAWVQGKDYHHCSKEDNPGYEGMYVCCKKLGGCDTDFCICGTNHGWATGKKALTLTSTAQPTNAPITLAISKETTATTTTTEEDTTKTTDSSSTENDSKTFWDMLIELCDPHNSDLQVFTWGDTCYVQPVPVEESAVLTVVGSENLEYDSLNITEGDPNLVNTVVVKYGTKATPQTYTAREDLLVNKYGEIKTEIVNYNLNREEAVALAEKELGKQQRDGEFIVECSVTGHPEWYIGRWAYFNIPTYSIQENYYITQIGLSTGASGIYQVDITAKPYRPIIENESRETDYNPADVEGILKLGAKFKYKRKAGSSDAATMERVGYGDCWAMSDWLYKKFTAANIRSRILQYKTSASTRHRSVQLYQNGTWNDVPYKQYGYAEGFRATSSKPGMKVYMGG